MGGDKRKRLEGTPQAFSHQGILEPYMSAWTRSCGWNFAQKSTDFYFVSGWDKLKCSKCDALRVCATSQMGHEMRTGFEEKPLMAGASTGVPANARKGRQADRTNSTK